MVLHTCHRCGEEFRGEQHAKVCAKCRYVTPKEPPQRGQKLTTRQRQVVELIAEGKSNREIAGDLHLTEGTIKVYVSTLLFIFGFRRRTELAVEWLGRKYANSGTSTVAPQHHPAI